MQLVHFPSMSLIVLSKSMVLDHRLLIINKMYLICVSFLILNVFGNTRENKGLEGQVCTPYND